MGASSDTRSSLRPAGAGVAAHAAFRPVNSIRRSHRERRSLRRALLPAAALVLGAALGYVWLQIRIVDVAYQLSTMRRVVDRLEDERRNLELEVAAAESPARLEEQGRKLGMGPPKWGKEVPLP